MLATLVIGLREGLEAALIVGIIAAFLRRNGRSLVPMWIGVSIALAASVGVGVLLQIVEASLPQAAQEGMESVIGAIAVVFVTGMILWMHTHARAMRRELESTAAAALHEGTTWALAGMAFLAVLKEGFETSVFLLATFQASTDTGLAAAGAVIGVLIAVVIGIGIYRGGVKLDLGKFFRVTGAFLIVVAAGLVVSALRTAHEAGWLNAGQQRTLDLSWLAPNGSVQAALISGVLGIPADPRAVEVVGWLAYLIPVALFVFWPARHRPTAAQAPRVQALIGGLALATGIVLAVVIPLASASTAAPLALTNSAGRSIGSATLDSTGARTGTLTTTVGSTTTTTALTPADASATTHDGVDATVWTMTATSDAGGATRMTFDQLVAAAGGRVPVGISAQANPGPFEVLQQVTVTRTVWASAGMLIDAHQSVSSVATVSGGGLPTPRTIGLAAPASAPAAWQVPSRDAAAAANAAANNPAVAADRALWGVALPIVLLLIAALLLSRARRNSVRQRRVAASAPKSEIPASQANPGAQQRPTSDRPTTESPAPEDEHNSTRSTTYAAH